MNKHSMENPVKFFFLILILPQKSFSLFINKSQGYARLTQLICILGNYNENKNLDNLCCNYELNYLHSTDWKKRKLLTIRILIITMEQKLNIPLDFCLLWGSTLKCWESRVKRTCHTCRYSSWQAASLVVAEIGSHSCFVVYHGCWLYSADHK